MVGQAQILNLLKDLQDRFNLSYLFISTIWGGPVHERPAVMYGGGIVGIGPNDIFDNPRHLHKDTHECRPQFSGQTVKRKGICFFEEGKD